MKSASIFFIALLTLSTASAFDSSKMTYFGGLDVGFGTQSTSNNESESKTDPLYGVSAFGSYDFEPMKLDAGFGWTHYKVKTDLTTGQYSRVTLKTDTAYVFIAPKFKITEKVLVGLDLRYMFDDGVMLAPNENVKLMGGVSLSYIFESNSKYEFRGMASVQKSLDSSNRDLLVGQLALQIGLKGSSDGNDVKPLKRNQKQMANGVVYTKPEKKKEVAQEVKAEPVVVIVQKKKVTSVNLDETLIHFESDSAVLDMKSKALLTELAAYLASNTEIWRGLEIIGHTDAVGGDEYNTILSVKRANSVYEVLSDVKLPKDRLIFKGKGKNEPVVNGSDMDALAKNRRVELRFYDVTDKDRLLGYIGSLTKKYQLK